MKTTHSEYCSKHKKECPVCAIALECTSCHIGGGSHYWRLYCKTHGYYDYDTYSFRLREVSIKQK